MGEDPLNQLLPGSWAPFLDAECNARGWPRLKPTAAEKCGMTATTVVGGSSGIWRQGLAGPQRQGQVASHMGRVEGHPRQGAGGPPELETAGPPGHGTVVHPGQGAEGLAGQGTWNKYLKSEDCKPGMVGGCKPSQAGNI